MKFKHYATDKIIEVEPVESEEYEIVFCNELNKYFRVTREQGLPVSLFKTSYILYERNN